MLKYFLNLELFTVNFGFFTFDVFNFNVSVSNLCDTLNVDSTFPSPFNVFSNDHFCLFMVNHVKIKWLKSGLTYSKKQNNENFQT